MREHPEPDPSAGGASGTAAESRWPRQRRPNGYRSCLTVGAVDLGASDTLAGYLECYMAPGSPRRGSATAYTAAGVRRCFVDDLASALGRGTVALGLEGPCWGEASGPLGPLVPRWFEEGSPSAWYDRAGGPAALKAAAHLAGLLAQLGGVVSEITYGNSPNLGRPGVLWVWEAYVTGSAKGVAGYPTGETWSYVDARKTSSRKSQDMRSPDIRDAFLAVRHGFANDPARPRHCGLARLTSAVGSANGLARPCRCHGRRGAVVPIIGHVVAASGTRRSRRVDQHRCAVVAPGKNRGLLLWP